MAETMTPRERVLATFRFEPTDRPAYDLMEGTTWPALMEYFGAERGLDSTDAVQEHLGADLRWISVRNLDADGKGRGGAADPAADPTYTFSVAHGPLADAETVAEVEAHRWPDPSRFVPPDFASFRRRYPDHAVAFLCGWKPLFWGSCDVFGAEEALVKMKLNPAVYEAYLRIRSDFMADLLERCLSAGEGLCDICWLGDDFASQQSMLLSPDDWRRFIKPHVARQVEIAHRHGMLALHHSCGAIRPVIKDFIEIGCDGLLVFQTRAAGMDAESIARDFGGRIAFYGGVDVQQLLSFGTPAQVRREVHRNLRAFAGRGGYIVANSHHCVDTIGGELLEAMCDAARDYRD